MLNTFLISRAVYVSFHIEQIIRKKFFGSDTLHVLVVIFFIFNKSDKLAWPFHTILP